MISLKYDTQSSHEGYIDMEFKEIVYGDHNDWPLHEDELFDAVINGYYVENHWHPKYMHKVFDFEGDYASARVSRRLVKRWCKNVCDNGFDY